MAPPLSSANTYVSIQAGQPIFDPPKAPPLSSGDTYVLEGSYVDEDAVKYSRPYHRLVLPMDASNTTMVNGQAIFALWCAHQCDPSCEEWRKHLIKQLRIRANCPLPTKCPAHDLPLMKKTAQESHRAPVAAKATPNPFTRKCVCQAGWADYGCKKPITRLTQSNPTSFPIGAGSWKYFNVKIPVLPISVVPYPALLVELTKRASGMSGGGDPNLFVKPIPDGETNSAPLPYYTDQSSYADTFSYSLFQNYHFQIIRDFNMGSSFNVAVYNSASRSAASTAATLTITARWAQGPSEVICPLQCSGRGTCYDPQNPSSSVVVHEVGFDAKADDFYCSCQAGCGGSFCEGKLNDLDFHSGSFFSAKDADDFYCSCQAGYGGSFCEGKLNDLDIHSGSFFSAKDVMSAPGQWDFYRLDIDGRNFLYTTDSIQLSWIINQDSLTGLAANSILSMTENHWPREADQSMASAFQVLLYSQLTDGFGSEPRPSQIRGVDLEMGAFYVIGIYNSLSMPYTYTITVEVPSPNFSWLKPYMSIIIGITASILLCVLLTLCKRHMQRRGLGPWRPSALTPEQDAASAGGAHMVPRYMQGVPASVVSDFESYEYKAPLLARAPRSSEDGATEGDKVGESARLKEREKRMAESAAATTEAATAAVAAAGGGVVGVERAVTRGGSRPTSALARGSRPTSAVPAVGGAGLVAATATLSQPLAGGKKVEAADGDGGYDDEAPSCTVCLCEYEEGEMMRRLPCRHEFHLACIDKWMTQHTTCPVCRTALVPEPTPEELEAEQQQQLEGQFEAMARGPWVISNGPNNTVFLAAPHSGEGPAGGNDQMGVVLVMYPGGRRAIVPLAGSPAQPSPGSHSTSPLLSRFVNHMRIAGNPSDSSPSAPRVLQMGSLRVPGGAVPGGSPSRQLLESPPRAAGGSSTGPVAERAVGSANPIVSGGSGSSVSPPPSRHALSPRTAPLLQEPEMLNVPSRLARQGDQ
eukprot:gene24890-10555_t